jgi:hypothetical protein
MSLSPMDGERPDIVVIGDEWYPLALADAARRCLITEDEFSRRYRLHKAVERLVGNEDAA